jgi:phage minor structural protein
MIPILFEPTATTFNTFGIGHLTDAIAPHVVEERNGEFTLEMQYPIDGEHYDEIGMRSIILAKPNPQQQPQPFRVHQITKPINGVVTIYAYHLRYDLAGVPVAPFSASSLYTALQAMVSNRLISSPFTFYTDKWSDTDMTNLVPTSTLALMGGQEGSLLDIYGGEYKTDIYEISLLNARGSDNGVVIRYGVDLIDVEQEESCANCYTGVLCFWQSMDHDVLVTGTVQSAGTFDYSKILVVDRSGNYEDAPTQERLNLDAINYINRNKVGVPRVSLTVSFANLEQTEEYKNIRQSIALCDYVTIKFEKLGVSAFAKVIRTDYDVLLERYISVDIGESRGNIADTIIGLSTFSESVPTYTEMQQAIDATTAAITGAEGGAVRLLDTNNDGEPDTLYVADDPNPLAATKVWRFNHEGWGASQNGYSGPFTMGATFQQGFLAEFITAGTLSADRIGANSISVSKLTGTIQSGDWVIDLDNGTLTIGSISASEITSGTLDASEITVLNLNADNITTGTLNVLRIADESLTGDKLADVTIPSGKIVQHTLSDLQMESYSLSVASLASGVRSSLGYADFSNSVFNSATRCSYLYTQYLDATTTARLIYGSIQNLSVGHGSSYWSATWGSISVTHAGTSAFQVYDTNGNVQWVGNLNPTGYSNSDVLEH